MSTQMAVRPVAGALHGIWSGGRRVERICYVIGLLLMLSGVFHFGVFLVKGGPWYGPVSWRKPTTFGLSFGLTLVTITWVSSYVRLAPRSRAVLLAVFAAACVLEVALISVQGWRHVPSHFNAEGPVNSAIASSLAFGGGLLIVVLATFTVASFRDADGVTPAMRLAVRAGFVALMFALASGAAMIGKGVVLARTGHQQAAYTAADALKPAHAVTMHAILVLPALAWLLSFTDWEPPRQVRLISRVTWVYAVAAGAVIIASLVKFV